MGLSEKKQTLLHIVEDADEKLTGLLIALATEYNSSSEEYTAEQIEEFYKIRDELINHPEDNFSKKELDFFNDRRKAFFKNDKKGYSVEEAHEKIRRNFNNGV